VVQQSASAVTDFTGLLIRADSASHAFLNLSIIRGTGVVTGSLTGAGGVIQVLRLVLGPDLSNSTHRVPLTPGLVCRDSQAAVTLKTSAGSFTRNVTCVTHTMRRVTRPPGHVTRALEAGDTWTCVTCPDTWLHWLHPHNWLDTSWPAARVIINILLTLILMVCLLVIIKMLRCLKEGTSAFCCFCHNTQSSKTRKDLKLANIHLKDYRKHQTKQENLQQKLPIL